MGLLMQLMVFLNLSPWSNWLPADIYATVLSYKALICVGDGYFGDCLFLKWLKIVAEMCSINLSPPHLKRRGQYASKEGKMYFLKVAKDFISCFGQ